MWHLALTAVRVLRDPLETVDCLTATERLMLDVFGRIRRRGGDSCAILLAHTFPLILIEIKTGRCCSLWDLCRIGSCGEHIESEWLGSFGDDGELDWTSLLKLESAHRQSCWDGDSLLKSFLPFLFSKFCLSSPEIFWFFFFFYLRLISVMELVYANSSNFQSNQWNNVWMLLWILLFRLESPSVIVGEVGLHWNIGLRTMI